MQAPQTWLSKNYGQYWAVGSLWELDYCTHEKGNFNIIINLQCNSLASWKCWEWTQAQQYTVVPRCFSNIREKDWLSTSVYGNFTKFFVCCPHRTSTTLAIHTTDNKTKKNKTSYNIVQLKYFWMLEWSNDNSKIYLCVINKQEASNSFAVVMITCLQSCEPHNLTFWTSDRSNAKRTLHHSAHGDELLFKITEINY